MLTNAITEAADLIGGEPELLKTALLSIINSDNPSVPCVEPNALAAAYRLLEHYALCRTILKLPVTERMKKRIDADYCEKVLNVARELLLVSAGGWGEIDN